MKPQLQMDHLPIKAPLRLYSNRFIRLKPGRERGQGMLELGISLVFMLILLSVLVDLGYAFYTLMSLRDAAQEAASYGSVCPILEDGSRNDLLIRERLRLSATEPLDMRDIDLNDIEITYSTAGGVLIPSPNPPVRGGSITVSVTVHHQIMVPFLSVILGRDDYPLMVDVTDTIIRSNWLDHCDY